MSHQYFRAKTVRCRYFDDTGRPVKPTCNQGERCSFVHPEDSQWATATSVSKKFANSPEASRRSAKLSSPPPSRHLPPLTPQSEVFKRSVPEKDTFFDFDDRRQSGSRSYENRSYLGVEKPNDRHSEKPIRAPRIFDDRERVRIKQEDNHRIPPKQPRPRDIFMTSPPARARNRQVTSPIAEVDSTPKPPTNFVMSQRKQSAEQIIDLFRKLAKTSSKVMQDTVAMERESQKLETYTELSSTLAKVSSSAAASVAPALVNIVQNHSLYKGHLEEELNVLAHIWEDIFQIFATGVGNVLDMSLQEAVTGLKRAGDDMSVEIQTRDENRKKKREDDDDDKGKDISCERDRKRRRVELEDGQVAEKNRFSSRSESRLAEMYEEMRSKLDRQAHKLDQLTKENSELKSVLRGPSRASDASTNKENVSDNWSDRFMDESDSGTSLWERINQSNERGR